MENKFKTSDIKINKDSYGYFTCKHKYQGTLIDGNFYETRIEARKEAVEVLKEKKEMDGIVLDEDRDRYPWL